MGFVDYSYTPKFMVRTLANKRKIEESMYYSGGINHLEMLLDLEIMLESANLTDKQKQVVELYYFNQLTQEEVSNALGISQQAVLDHIKKIKQKITKVIEGWNQHEE